MCALWLLWRACWCKTYPFSCNPQWLDKLKGLRRHSDWCVRGEIVVPRLTVQFSFVVVPPTETTATSVREAEGNQYKQSQPLQQTLQEARFSSVEQKPGTYLISWNQMVETFHAHFTQITQPHYEGSFVQCLSTTCRSHKSFCPHQSKKWQYKKNNAFLDVSCCHTTDTHASLLEWDLPLHFSFTQWLLTEHWDFNF